MSRKEYMRDYRAKKRNNVTGQDVNVTQYVTAERNSVTSRNNVTSAIHWHPEVDQSIFKGRGVPVDGFVLISMGRVADDMPECQVVTKDTWLARLKQVCSHGFKGWTCKHCLQT